MIGGGEPVPDEGHKEVPGNLLRVGLEAEEGVRSPRQRHAVHLEDIVLFGVHDEDTGVIPEDVGFPVPAIDKTAVKLRFIGCGEQEVAPCFTKETRALTAARDQDVIAIFAVDLQPHVFAGLGAMAQGVVEVVVVADHFAGKDVLSILNVGDVVTAAHPDFAVALEIVAVDPARDVIEIGVPHQILTIPEFGKFSVADTQPVVVGPLLQDG